MTETEGLRDIIRRWLAYMDSPPSSDDCRLEEDILREMRAAAQGMSPKDTPATSGASPAPATEPLQSRSACSGDSK